MLKVEKQEYVFGIDVYMKLIRQDNTSYKKQ